MYGRTDVGVLLFVPFFTYGRKKREALTHKVPNAEYVDLGFDNPIGQIMAEVMMSLLIVVGIVVMIISVQQSRFQTNLTKRLSRRK